jgi:hypothetical protein
MATRTRETLGDFDEIAAAAVRTTGLDHFGGTEHEEGLRLLCEDLVEHGGLTPEGNYMQRTFVKSALVGRLLAEHGFHEHPSYVDVAIRRPIFVCGLPRTGTTALHRLLNADPSHQGLELWLTEVPQPRPPRESWGDNPVFNALNSAFSEHHVENPEFMGIHYMDAASVEECWRVLRQSGKSIGYESLAHVPAYSAWLEKQQWTDAYQRHRANLQLIGLNDPEKQWVLKNPSHLVGLDAIMEVYPDALIVQTHRDPLNVISSVSALTNHQRRMASDQTSIADCAVQSHEEIVVGLERGMKLRDSGVVPPEQIVDVQFADFVRDPFATVRDLYTRLGRELSLSPNNGCASTWPPIRVTAGAAATRGPTRVWMPARCASRSVPIRSATGCLLKM